MRVIKNMKMNMNEFFAGNVFDAYEYFGAHKEKLLGVVDHYSCMI